MHVSCYERAVVQMEQKSEFPFVAYTNQLDLLMNEVTMPSDGSQIQIKLAYK